MTPGSVLALNLGSATLKAAWFADRTDPAALPTPQARLELPARALTRRADDDECAAPAHETSREAASLAELLAEVVRHQPEGVPAPTLIAHRIVHGGERTAPLRLDATGREALSALNGWAPLHQAAALALAAAAAERWPAATQVGVFDTLWHRTLPPVSRTLPLSAGVRARGVQRYGFHGLAFQSAFRQLDEARPGARERCVVLAHLGSGSSLCAVAQGRSIDTTMSLTPLDGLPMATRCGSLDPGVVLFLARELRLGADALETELGHNSGLRGISGTTGDMRHLLASSSDEARLAIEVFTLKVAQGIAAMATSLGGLDDIVFTGGIGSHAAPVRAAIVRRLAWLGLVLEDDANARGAPRIDGSASSGALWVFTVDEERELAHAALRWAAAQVQEPS